MFQIIHQLTIGPEDTLMIAKDVIQEFTDDGVKSLELDKEASEQGTYQRENATGMTRRHV